VGVVVNSDELAELVDPEGEVERIGTGFTFTEGPLWNAEGAFLLFSDMPGDTRRRWSPDGGVEEVLSPSNKGNGMVYDAQGRLLVCEHVTSSLVRMDPDGSGSGREVLATHHEGKELNSPNDVITKSDGTILFTDPTYGRMPGFGIEREQELAYQGVYRVGEDPEHPELLLDDFVQPNGLCFSPDERLLYVNDTDRAHIRVFELDGDGRPVNGRVFAEGIGTGDLESGELVDGMKCDERGGIWVTGPKGVWVFNASGEHLGIIEVPENVGNIAWGGPGWRTLFIPASTSMYRIETKVASTRLPYH
jgi:gluconolactonase